MVNWSSEGVLVGPPARAGWPGAAAQARPPPHSPAASASWRRRRADRGATIPSGDLLEFASIASQATRPNVSSDSKAQSRWPDRICGEPNSTEHAIHASRIRLTTCGERAGGRALPVFSRRSPPSIAAPGARRRPRSSGRSPPGRCRPPRAASAASARSRRCSWCAKGTAPRRPRDVWRHVAFSFDDQRFQICIGPWQIPPVKKRRRRRRGSKFATADPGIPAEPRGGRRRHRPGGTRGPPRP